MSSPNTSEQELQKLQEHQQNKQQQEEDMDVEDTVVSPLLQGNSEESDAFAVVPMEIVQEIMDKLDPVSQLCFSLTKSIFYKMLRSNRGPLSYLGYLHSSDFEERQSLHLTTRASVCGYYFWDEDDADLYEMPSLNRQVGFDPSGEDTVPLPYTYHPCIADLLWNERFFWSGGAWWCDGCYRVLPPSCWDECDFERKFWDSRSQAPELITNLLARSHVQGLIRDPSSHFPGDPDDTLLRGTIASDRLTKYESTKDDINYNLCVKCRLKEVVTDCGRRRQTWKVFMQNFEDTGKPPNAVMLNGGFPGEHRERYDVLNPGKWRGIWDLCVSWQDVWRECGLVVKEYKE